MAGRNWRTYISRCRIKDGIMSLVIDSFSDIFNDIVGREPVILGKNVTTIRFGWKGIEPSGHNFLPLYYKRTAVFFRPDAETAITAVTFVPHPLSVDDATNPP